MNLYLLRHGLAVEPGTAGYTHDADRALTPEGKRKLKQVAAAMKALELDFDLILSSPYVRAAETAEVIASALDIRKRLQLSPELAPGSSSKRLVEHLRGLRPAPENLLLVGHEPGMSRLVSLLVWGDAEGTVVMKKAGLCKLSIEALRHGRCAALEWLLTPRQMALLA